MDGLNELWRANLGLSSELALEEIMAASP
jgi:hypothetical protein